MGGENIKFFDNFSDFQIFLIYFFYTLQPLSNIDFTVIINHFNFFTGHLAYHHLKSENAPRDLTFFLTHL